MANTQNPYCSRCGEMADAQDLKSWDLKKSCRFESDHRHQKLKLPAHSQVQAQTNSCLNNARQLGTATGLYEGATFRTQFMARQVERQRRHSRNSYGLLPSALKS